MNAKIFLSENRGRQEFSWFRSFQVFNFGDYQHMHRQPAGDLYVFNEDTLAGGKSYQLDIEQNSCIIIIPVAGAIMCNDQMIIPGESMIMDIVAGGKLNVANPYEKENDLVNFIQLWFKKEWIERNSFTIKQFDITERDQLRNVLHNAEQVFAIGKFKGRSNALYEKKNATKELFVFVIEGVFEVEDRLLHAGDGLSLNNCKRIEFEALSNDAIILITEVRNL